MCTVLLFNARVLWFFSPSARQAVSPVFMKLFFPKLEVGFPLYIAKKKSFKYQVLNRAKFLTLHPVSETTVHGKKHNGGRWSLDGQQVIIDILILFFYNC